MRERPNWRAALWLRRHRIRGKEKFIWSIVVGRLAIPAAVFITIGWSLYEPFVGKHFVLHVLANSVAAVIGGYVAGVILWDLVVNRGGRRVPARRAPPATRAPEPREPSDPPAPRFEE